MAIAVSASSSSSYRQSRGILPDLKMGCTLLTHLYIVLGGVFSFYIKFDTKKLNLILTFKK